MEVLVQDCEQKLDTGSFNKCGIKGKITVIIVHCKDKKEKIMRIKWEFEQTSQQSALKQEDHLLSFVHVPV